MRRVLGGQINDLLLHVVFEQMEVVFAQTRNGPVQQVVHGYGNEHTFTLRGRAGSGRMPARAVGT